MAYQEVTTTGYGTRVGNSFKAIGGGFLMFVLGTALLWWNEGRAVKTEKMLDEAGNAYVEMENPNKKDASLEGELICGSAMALAYRCPIRHRREGHLHPPLGGVLPMGGA